MRARLCRNTNQSLVLVDQLVSQGNVVSASCSAQYRSNAVHIQLCFKLPQGTRMHTSRWYTSTDLSCACTLCKPHPCTRPRGSIWHCHNGHTTCRGLLQSCIMIFRHASGLHYTCTKKNPFFYVRAPDVCPWPWLTSMMLPHRTNQPTEQLIPDDLSAAAVPC